MKERNYNKNSQSIIIKCEECMCSFITKKLESKLLYKKGTPYTTSYFNAGDGYSPCTFGSTDYIIIADVYGAGATCPGCNYFNLIKEKSEFLKKEHLMLED